MVLLLTEDDVVTSVTYEALYDAIEGSLRQWHSLGVGHQPRSRLSTGTTTLHVLAGKDAVAGSLGVKAYAARHEGTDHVVLLYRDSDGGLDAIVAAGALGVMRTGVASAIATRHMHGDTRVLGVIGTGKLATTNALAIAANNPGLAEIRVFGRDPAKRDQCVAGIGKARAVASVEEACAGADVVCTTTSAREPVLRLADLDTPVHVNAVGSNSLTRVEIDPEIVARSSIVVDSREQARHEAGDLLAAAESNQIDWRQLPDLGEVVSGLRVPAERDVMLFESLGIGVFDVTAATLAVRIARERGLGTEIGL